MQLLICSATAPELHPTYQYLKNINAGKAEILITGVGMLQTMYHLSAYINSHKPDLIIQAGISGSFSNDLEQGQVVCVRNESIGDLGVKENNEFVSVFDMNLIDKNEFPWENGVLKNNDQILNDTGLKIVNGITVNEITTDLNRINYYINQGAEVESMEGAALHYLALMENIPFLQLRSVSNKAGERDKTKWDMKKAIEQLNFELQRIIFKLNLL
ncbi:MAG: futalosine hydrolase [Flavisolibacter sp.]